VAVALRRGFYRFASRVTGRTDWYKNAPMTRVNAATFYWYFSYPHKVAEGNARSN
jgi:hypothetical protein